MVAPADVRLFTVAAYKRQCLADDVDYFYAQLDPDPASTLDACIRAAGPGTPDARLREVGLRSEERYLAWRARNHHLSMGASRLTYDCFAGQVEEFVGRIALALVGVGHHALTERAMRRAESEFGYLTSLALMKRAARRCWHDSNGYDPARIEEMCRISNEAFVESDEGGERKIESLRRAIGKVAKDGLPEGWDRRAARAYMRQGATMDRRAIKRSVRSAERFVGTETTRLFVSGEAIRITGRLATYELTRTGDLMKDHGGARLSLYTRDGDTLLCHLCLYTAGVPLLDHVTGIFLHVLAGEEEALLQGGNPYDATPAAAGHPWLAPHIARNAGARGEGLPDRGLPTRRLVRELSLHLFDEFGHYCPSMPETRSLLANGCMQADIVVMPHGEDREGMVRVEGHDLGFPALAAA